MCRKGLVVKEAQGAVQAAGMKPGDRIAALERHSVWTFGDLQYQYDKIDRRAEKIQITVDRGGQPVDLTVALPARWWWTDLRFRQSSVEPRLVFRRPSAERSREAEAGTEAGQLRQPGEICGGVRENR